MIYQDQIVNLIREFHQSTHKKYKLKNLMNNREFRNQCFTEERQKADSKVKLIISQVEAFEDLLDCEFQVDLVPQEKSQNYNASQKWALTAFALAGLLFIAGSITAIEQIKHNRQQVHLEIQAD
jgi:hypothetical protein